ncbi:MAG TPA: ABC transporter permease [Vicinamibacterales bacterium]|nr:ABC transporter permease [Vicinamibacterales bacterium]
MLRGLLTLTWLEIKIFVREPLGVFGTVAVPVLIFVLFGRLFGPRMRGSVPVPRFVSADLPIFASILIVLGAVMSVVTVVAIYREGGILKRLRATPLRPYTILLAHVAVKLGFVLLTLGLMVLAGRRYYPIGADVPWLSFTLALLFTTICLISLGFVLASLVPTARFAQPLGTLVFYPMLGLCGLFVPIAALPSPLQMAAKLLPLTYCVSLLRGIWQGEGWFAHLGDVGALLLVLVGASALSVRLFRWE